MLNKKNCKRCHQLHERKWEEEVWDDGYVTCPTECFSFVFHGKPIEKDDLPSDMFLKSVFGLRSIKNDPPLYCDFVHERIARGN